MALKNRKTRKYRGSRTCGGGNVKMRRGAGHRGGRGNAGIKNHRKTWYLTHDPSALVNKGPGRPNVPRNMPSAINIATLEERLEEFIASGIAKKKAKEIHLDLSEIGYDKLLGSGVTKNSWVITARSASETASRKISDAGGKVITEEEAASQDSKSEAEESS